jgi:MinD superfamily P-loop ATPase
MIKGKPLNIAIASGKGGTGKTLVATNLACLLSQSERTLLVDLDVEEPNDSIFIKGTEVGAFDQYKMIPEWSEVQCTHCDVCSNSCAYHAIVRLGSYVAVFNELCHSCYACSELCPAQALPMRPYKIGETKTINSGNLVFIESRLEVGEEQAVPLIHRTHDHILNNGYHDFSILVFDCPPGTSCPVVAAVKNADLVLLVTEPTPFGLNDLKLAVNTMQLLNKDIAVVINRSDIGNNEVDNYCEQMKVPIIAKIPYDDKIARLYSNGQLIFDKVNAVLNPFHKMVNYIHNFKTDHE